MSSPLPRGFAAGLREAIGSEYVRSDPASIEGVSADALGIPHAPELVALPGSTRDVAAIARACHESRVPLVVRGAGTGYTGGAVPTAGGVVLSMERLNRILEIDSENLLAVVEPNVVTGDLQSAVERVGLFYPPDPASLDRSSIGGNVAECAGGPRAFKYGTTKRYVLALEAVLPTGEIVHTGSKAVKNVVGYDLTQLLVGSEGTLAIITKVTLRLIPKPAAAAAVAAAFSSVQGACGAVTGMIRRHVVPTAIELIDADSLRAIESYAKRAPWPAGAEALLLVECDGTPASVEEEIGRAAEACVAAGAVQMSAVSTGAERDALWAVRRDLSLALRATGLLKINHDVVVPRGRIPQLFAVVDELRREYRLQIASFGHAGDGNIHVNLMVDRDDASARARAREAERVLFERVVALEGSISGEHGIGFAKSSYLGMELSPEVVALMKRVKAAFDPHGILNPGKIFP
jgi:glycolate oxidase